MFLVPVVESIRLNSELTQTFSDTPFQVSGVYFKLTSSNMLVLIIYVRLVVRNASLSPRRYRRGTRRIGKDHLDACADESTHRRQIASQGDALESSGRHGDANVW
jgi:hypothetical protein